MTYQCCTVEAKVPGDFRARTIKAERAENTTKIRLRIPKGPRTKEVVFWDVELGELEKLVAHLKLDPKRCVTKGES